MSGNGFDPDFASAGQWARLYRSHAVQVVPACAFLEVGKGKSWKRPLLKSWTDFQEALVPDDVFEKWYGLGGQYATRDNMGVITGRASNNLFVIDLDTHKTILATEWWRGLMAIHNNGLDLETVEQRTGGGGLQKLFRAAPGWIAPTNKTTIGVDIRGQGGFAMLAPSLHESGKHYEWLEGCSPDDIDIATAPDWLLAEVERLVAEHGGVTPGVSRETAAGTRSGRPQNSQYDAFGHQTDARETKMRDLIWGAIVDWRRECPIKPSEAESTAKAAEKYVIYESLVSPRTYNPAFSKTSLLEAEGRGFSAFADKWQYAMRQWDDEVAAEAKKPGKPFGNLEDEFEPARPRVDPTTGQPLPLILTDAQFVKDFKPPDYLVDGMIQKGYLYSLTGPTGHGKTPVSMLMGCKVARGLDYHGKPVTQGGVLFLAGENSDDIRARYIAMADHEGFAIGSIPFHFIDGVIDIRAEMPRIEAEAASIHNLSLVIIDTDQAYFLGDEGNSNEQRKWFAKILRGLLQLPGNPAALVNCHPTKNATQDNLVPIGGSSFLNEVDGNITCWTEDRTCTIRPHASKWRGVAFESLVFELRTITSDRLKDTKGRYIPSVIAVPITEEGAQRREAVTEEDDKSVLRMLHRDKNASQASVARALGWFMADKVTPSKTKVARAMDRLREGKFVYKFHGSKYRLTKKGCKLIGEKWEAEDDE